ncbi:Uncharacterised protein [Slackia heliotrinireducens]|uniref:Uncharacterized protein n=1 Tax=Slackia heliotrinireducens (strain ATCC 29202 / DSM 20476 / NCTC 11029 / RHS 1) TaxID=471855 RepID=C7N6H4_SLAHD|nr:hypothetical protein [Slackia heliotrinireducens]ACV22509.1 hypothetical protein Shel_14890 [Slackia heliotrinireducens DSM 20476]VEH00935.1 Uncharacterised protein [Slackia heliotrinireducens]
MLFVLTGDIQTGKTRWLEALVSELERSGAGVFGVVSPGVWEQGPREGEFRKLAIDNVLLPGCRRIRMADWIDPSDTNRDDQGSVVRDWLADRVVSRYEDTWRKVRVIGPCAESREVVLGACVPDSVSDVR